MRFRILGRTNIHVSEMSFGAARGASEDPRRFDATVRAAIDGGVNLIDTAEGYDRGESERTLGGILGDYPDVLVETKYCPYESYLPEAAYNGTPQALVASAEKSLRRLRRDRLDILLGHGIRTVETWDRFLNDGCYEAMVKLRDQGKVRFIGISELSEGDGSHEVLKCALPSGVLDVVMLTINVLLQNAIGTVLPLCHEYGAGSVVMMPLNQASKESGLVSLPAALECVRRHIEQGNLPASAPYTEATLFDFLKPYSIPEASLRFVLAQKVSTCCVGARSPERIAEDLSAVDPPYLDTERLEHLAALFGRISRQVR